jgi:hypothetical protein
MQVLDCTSAVSLSWSEVLEMSILKSWVTWRIWQWKCHIIVYFVFAAHCMSCVINRLFLHSSVDGVSLAMLRMSLMSALRCAQSTFHSAFAVCSGWMNRGGASLCAEYHCSHSGS